MQDATALTRDAAPSPARATGPVITKGTRIACGVLAAVFVALFALDFLRYSGPLAAFETLISSALMVVPLFSAPIMIAVAWSFGKGGTIRLTWMLLALSALIIAIGSLWWTVLYLQTGADVWPSMADVFYTLFYPVQFVALVLAIWSYHRIVDYKKPLLVAAVVGIAGAVVAWFTVIGPYVVAAAGMMPPLGVAFGITYPLADCLLMLAPAVMLGLMARQLGAGRIAWPWYVIASATVVEALTDATYTYLKFSGQSGFGLWTDVGWVAVELLFVAAVFVARDVYRS